MRMAPLSLLRAGAHDRLLAAIAAAAIVWLAVWWAIA